MTATFAGLVGFLIGLLAGPIPFELVHAREPVGPIAFRSALRHRPWLSPRTILVAIAMAAGFAAIPAVVTPPHRPMGVAVLGLVTVFGTVLSIIDCRVHRLPDLVVAPFGATALGLAATGALVVGDPWRLGRALLAGVLVGALLAGMRMLSGGGFGWGDVKVGAVLAVLLGWFGWTTVLTGLMAAFLGGGLAAAVVLVRRRDRSAALPFGPWLFVGAAAAIVLSTG